ncbi:hypothetical protein [Endozoicomonas lisbonensis]|uniref:hypothetical protein n=1 Tax=Endozoicomonas lisbonensis TaxID=3120522 RepID=UPI0033990597
MSEYHGVGSSHDNDRHCQHATSDLTHLPTRYYGIDQPEIQGAVYHAQCGHQPIHKQD